MDQVSEARREAESARAVSSRPERAGAFRARFASAAAEPLARAQRRFNDAILRLADALSERLDAASTRAAAAERRVRELDERVLRLERRDAGAPRTVAHQPRQDALPDYFAFEARMRSPTEETRERQLPYLELLRDAAPVLDLGCGRGELLALLRTSSVEARGVDANADMVAFARGEGLEVEQADLLDHLAPLPDASLGALTALQVVEHLPPPALLRLLDLAAAKLRPDGVLLLETINPLAPQALRNYFADLTHAQPLVPETLEALVRGAGFREVETRYLNEPPSALAEPELPTGGEWDAARTIFAANVRLLNAQLFAPLDYAIVARR
jgi:SAM-dependent methyltransferase